jgi:hypothetical protein
LSQPSVRYAQADTEQWSCRVGINGPCGRSPGRRETAGRKRMGGPFTSEICPVSGVGDDAPSAWVGVGRPLSTPWWRESGDRGIGGAARVQCDSRPKASPGGAVR